MMSEMTLHWFLAHIKTPSNGGDNELTFMMRRMVTSKVRGK